MSMNEKTLRVPPQSLDMELNVLGSILIEPSVLDEIGDILTFEDFYSTANAITWRRLNEMYNRGQQAIDAAILGEELTAHGELQKVGGFEYLQELLEAVPHAAHAVHYAEKVAERSYRRRLITAAQLAIEAAHNDTEDLGETIGRADRSLAEISSRRVRSNSVSIGTLAREVIERVQERRERRNRGQSALGATSGFRVIDEITSGFQPSELTILAARPAMGKTAFAVTVAFNAAMAGTKTLFFSLEQKPVELAERLMANRSRINAQSLRIGTATDADVRNLKDSVPHLDSVPLEVDQQPERSISEFITIARRKARKEGVGLFVIDYLQLLEPFDKREPREQQVARISRSLKVVARELNVSVLALAQLNRAVEGRDNKRPRLADLRESGSLEQDADQVWFLHRPDAYDTADRPGEAEIVVAKNRSGPTGTATIAWKGQFMRFEDLTSEPDHDWIGRAFQ